jgi:4-amino-4-deoxy-L-arabinose transferase-like glycosyltransferase
LHLVVVAGGPTFACGAFDNGSAAHGRPRANLRYARIAELSAAMSRSIDSPMPSGTPDCIAVSVVVPAHDEAPNLERLAHDVRAALDPCGVVWELIVVDDGSIDETPSLLARLAAVDPRIHRLRLPTRSGQTAALVTGFHAARGRLVATLDADLQCPARDLPALLTALGAADLACGIRTARRDPLRRRIVSALTNLVRRCVLAPRLRDLACPLRVFRREALAQLETRIPLFDGAHRWLPALFILAGLHVVQRPVTHEPRRAGVSKYTATGRAWPIAREAGRVLEIALHRKRGLRVAAAVAGLAVLALPFLFRLGAWPLTEPDEGRNAEVAREMLQFGNWSVPHFNHLPYLDKPVLLFWAMAAAYRALGVSEFAARLPSALAAIGTVALTFAVARALLDTRQAVVATVSVATAPLVLVFARAAIFDMLLTFLMTAALFSLLQARLTGNVWRWWPLAGLTTGLAVLCKGPVGLAVPLLAWFTSRGALQPMHRRASPAAAVAAVLLGTLVVLPWVALVQRHEPGFLRYVLVDETLLRVTSTAGVHRGGPPYYYVVALAWAGGVWGALLVALIPALVRRWRAGGTDAAAIAFAARAAGAIVLFFTVLASKRPQYILPALVPIGVLIAAGANADPQRVARTLRLLGGVALLTGITTVIVGHVGAAPARGHLRALTPTVLATAGFVVAAWGVLTTTVARRSRAALACAALLAPALGLGLLGPMGVYAESRSARDIARNIPAHGKVVCLQTFRTSLPFYLQRPVVLVTRDAHELTSRYVTAMRSRLMGDEYLQSVERFADVIAADPDVFVLTKEEEKDVRRLAKRPLVRVYAHRRSLLLQPAG